MTGAEPVVAVPVKYSAQLCLELRHGYLKNNEI